MNEELQSIKQNKVYAVQNLPTNATVLQCKWVYTIKSGLTVYNKRYKARLVIRGDLQDSLELDTYAPVAKLVTFRALVTIVAYNKLYLHEMNIITAFLHAGLSPEQRVYMHIPPDADGQSGQIWLLLKALYGLKQASRLWNDEI